jgi:hypothetical protein
MSATRRHSGRTSNKSQSRGSGGSAPGLNGNRPAVQTNARTSFLHGLINSRGVSLFLARQDVRGSDQPRAGHIGRRNRFCSHVGSGPDKRFHVDVRQAMVARGSAELRNCVRGTNFRRVGGVPPWIGSLGFIL